MINPGVISGVILIILKYSTSRIVDPKVENDTPLLNSEAKASPLLYLC